MLIDGNQMKKIIIISIFIGIMYAVISIMINDLIGVSIFNGLVVSILLIGMIANIVKYLNEYNHFKNKEYEIIEWKKWIDILIIVFIVLYFSLIIANLISGAKLGGIFLLSGVGLLYNRITPLNNGSRLIISDDIALVENVCLLKEEILGFYVEVSNKKAKTVTLFLSNGTKYTFLLYRNQIDSVEKNNISRLISIPS